jgi:hypothetical protein
MNPRVIDTCVGCGRTMSIGVLTRICGTCYNRKRALQQGAPSPAIDVRVLMHNKCPIDMISLHRHPHCKNKACQVFIGPGHAYTRSFDGYCIDCYQTHREKDEA